MDDLFDVAPFEHLGLAKACMVHDGIERCFYTYDGSRGGTKAPLTCVTTFTSTDQITTMLVLF